MQLGERARRAGCIHLLLLPYIHSTLARSLVAAHHAHIYITYKRKREKQEEYQLFARHRSSKHGVVYVSSRFHFTIDVIRKVY